MKSLRFCIFCFLFSTQCLGMVFSEQDESQISHPNPQANNVLRELKKRHQENTLQPEVFWEMMEVSTGMGSCFLGEFIAASSEKDVCLVFEYLIKFGTINKQKFFESMRGCLGIDGITPLSELILRMPAIPFENSKIIEIFHDLLDLIKTLDQQQKLELLNREEVYRPCPIMTANRLGKSYIVNAMADIIIPNQALQIPGNLSDSAI